MKIPGIVKADIPDFRAPSVDAPLQLAAAVSNAAQDIAQGFTQYREKQAKVQMAEAASSVFNDIAAFETANANKIEYDPDELDPEIADKVRTTEEVFDPDTNSFVSVKRMVPAGEVYPYLYKNVATKSIAAHGEKIAEPRFKGDWNRNLTSMADEHLAAASLKAIDARRQESNDRLAFNIQGAMQNEQYDIADALVGQMEVSTQEKDKLRHEISLSRETDPYLKSMSEENVPDMKRHLAFLEAKDYPQDGKLDEQQRLTYVRQLRSAIDSTERAGSARMENQLKLLNDEGRSLVQQIAEGKQFTSGQVEMFQRKYSALQNVNGWDPVLQNDLNRAVRLHSETSKLAHMTLQEKNAAISSGVLAQASDNAYQSEDKEVLSKALQTQANEQASNNVDYAAKYGVMKFAPVDGQDPQVPVASQYAKRKEDVGALTLLTGHFTGFFTDEERKAKKQQWDLSRSATEKAQMLDDINRGFGDKSVYAYQEIFGGDRSSAAVAGEMIASGKPTLAVSILHGQTFGDQYVPKDLGPDGNTDLYVNDLIGRAYDGTSERKARVTAASKDLFSFYVSQGSRADKSTMERAVKEVTGGNVQVGRGTIEPPIIVKDGKRRPASSTEITQFVNTTDPSFLDQFGGSSGLSNKETMDQWRKGKLYPVQVGYNQYHLTNGNQVLYNKSGKPLVMSFPESMSYKKESGSVFSMGKEDSALVNRDRFHKLGVKPEDASRVSGGGAKLKLKSGNTYEVLDDLGNPIKTSTGTLQYDKGEGLYF